MKLQLMAGIGSLLRHVFLNCADHMYGHFNCAAVGQPMGSPSEKARLVTDAFDSGSCEMPR